MDPNLNNSCESGKFDSQYSVLSDLSILKYIENKKIIIQPFNRKQLNTSSYDVTLGSFFYREQKISDMNNYYNIYDKEMVNKVWGQYQKAKSYSILKNKFGLKFKNIKDDDEIILLKPGETILGHTIEFIGGVQSVTSMMKARSSFGRNFINVCSCAGWGDCGYYNRWTMEIKNNSQHYVIPLVVGRPIAQIIFIETDGIINKSYNKNGKYQSESNIKDLIKNWSPIQMLPKLYKEIY